MGFKKGALVIFKDQNWIVNDIISTTHSSGVLTVLKIKNVITNEIRDVDANQVKEFIVNKPQEQSVGDTKFINDLFQQGINLKDQYEKTDTQVFGTNSNTQEYTTTDSTGFLENELVMNTSENPNEHNKKQLTADDFGFGEVGVVDETISDFTPIGVLNTYEFIPTRLQKNMESDGNKLNLNSRMPNNPHLDNEITQEIIFNETQRKEISRPIEETVSHTFIEYAVKNKTTQPVKTEVFPTKTVSQTIEKSSKIIDEEFETTQTDKMMLKGITNNLQEENHSQNTKTFGPLNTRRLMEDFENHIANNKYNVEDFDDEDLTGLISNNSKSLKKKSLRNSKNYQSFKKMTTGLIIILVLVFLLPLIAIFMKLTTFWLKTDQTGFSILGVIFIGKLTQGFEIVYLISDIILLIITPILLMTFIIYFVVFVLVMNDKQFKKILLVEQDVKTKNKILEGIQDYNSQTSRYFVKIHNDIKETKGQVKELKKIIDTDFEGDSDQKINIAH